MADAGSAASDKRKAFFALHGSGCFVIPNPWNLGTARYLQGLGFKAIASTSAGYAHSLGRPDGGVSLDEALDHYREIAEGTGIPLNADFENGFADDPEQAARNVQRCIATGVAGLSIEDAPQHDRFPLYDYDVALARVKAARAAVDAAGREVVLTARTEGFIRGRPDIAETVRRIEAFAAAGADCLYAPGIRSREHIAAIVKAAGGRPVNFLNAGAFGYTVADLAALGVRRISVGGTLSRVAMDAFIASAKQIAEQGRFDRFEGVVSNAELNRFFRGGA
jgi:2-methylisocitrate lyase-like PEP mutase family enzyme